MSNYSNTGSSKTTEVVNKFSPLLHPVSTHCYLTISDSYRSSCVRFYSLNLDRIQDTLFFYQNKKKKNLFPPPLKPRYTGGSMWQAAAAAAFAGYTTSRVYDSTSFGGAVARELFVSQTKKKKNYFFTHPVTPSL